MRMMFIGVGIGFMLYAAFLTFGVLNWSLEIRKVCNFNVDGMPYIPVIESK
jgi:hypothetical protein